MQENIRIPSMRPPGILLLASLLVAVAALSLRTGKATYAQTESSDTLSPPMLTATSAGANTIELRWTAVASAESYRLVVWDRAINDWRPIGGALTGTSYIHRGLTAGTTYHYHLRAVAGGATSGWSAQVSATVAASGALTVTPTVTPTATPTSAPAQASTATPTPTAVALSVPTLTAETGAGEITLRWGAVTNAESYLLIVWDRAINDWRPIGGGLTGTTYTHRGLTAGTTYYYHIQAVAGGATSAWSALASATVAAAGALTVTPTVTPTATPTSAPAQASTATPTPTAVALSVPTLTAETGAGEITLRWGAVTNAESYLLIVWDRAINDWRPIGGGLTGTTYTHRGLTAGTTYYYHIQAVAGGATSAWSAQVSATVAAAGALTVTPTVTPTATPTSAPAQASTATPTPTAVALSVPTLTAETGAGEITLRWGAVTNAESYLLIVWDRAINDWRPIGGGLTGTTYTHRGLTAGTTYHYHIQAVAGGATSAWSAQVSATAAPSGTSTPTPTPATTDRGALIALYEATDGANWMHNHNWLSNEPLPTWHGVVTDANGRVIGLNLRLNRLSGTLPVLRALTELERLNLEYNSLRGPIPDLSALNNLKLLNLAYNGLNGQIPDLSVFTNLEHLNLGRNRLSGPVPQLNTLTNLTYLNLGSNDLTGAIPALSALTNLTYLNLAANELSGSIPDLSALSLLTKLDLSENRLGGPIPGLGALSSLTTLDLRHNDLSGSIPDLSALSSLNELLLSRNELSGSIPALNALTSLKELSLDDNDLSGSIPDLNALTRLTTIFLYQNMLSGPLPDMGALSNLQSLFLNENELTGPIFVLQTLTSLGALDLTDNDLSGPIPDLSALRNLRFLQLAGNRFCLPAGASLSHPNMYPDANLKKLQLAACTEADLAAFPPAPQNLTATVASGRVTLTWDATSTSASYELWAWDSLNRRWSSIGGPLTARNYTYTVQTDGRNYYFQVRARNAEGVRGPWSARAQAIVVPQQFPPPPLSLGLNLFYQKYLEVGGVVIVAPTEVSDGKMVQAREIVSGMLSGKPDLLADIDPKYVRIVIYKTNAAGEKVIQLPEAEVSEQNPDGQAFFTSAGWVAVAPESDPLCYVFIHEFAHALHGTIEEDIPGIHEVSRRLYALYTAALDAGLWQGAYAATDVEEYWAETVTFWFQGKLPVYVAANPTKLEDYDPEIAKLIAKTFGDASVPSYCKK